ncbi:MAG: Holliday junction resolvase RuvX [Holosporales bacterium]|jgi:putative Holliday junction resolvase|nr:Holliday junction resolvase RuvX [Holosporales bacterium]
MFITIDELFQIWKINPKERRLIGIDWGEKHIGIAVSDRSGIIASPLTTVMFRHNKKVRRVVGSSSKNVEPQQKTSKQLLIETVKDVASIIKSEHPIAISFGIPISMNGTDGPQVLKALIFANQLLNVVDTPIILADERLSSAAVEKVMIQADLTRAKRAKCIDQASAAYVLQGIVDQLNLKEMN